MESKEEYEFVRGNGNNDELEKYRQCFLENGSPKIIELLKWFHQQNLPGLQKIYYAIDKDTNQIAAIYTYLPVFLKCMNKVVVAMQSFDTLTDSRHRSKGLFIKLATKLEEEERVKNNELVYGIPNENSVSGFVKKLDFHYFGEVPFLIKPIKLSYFIRKAFKKKNFNEKETNCNIDSQNDVILKNNCAIKFITKFDDNHNKLWQKISPLINIGINRDAAYMNWRYIEKPGENYSRYGFYANGILKGIVVFTLKNKHDGKIGYLMEILFDPEEPISGKILLKFCTKMLKKNHADLILAWCFPHSFNYFCHRKAGFYNFPEKIRPQKLGMIAKTLNSNNQEAIYNIKNWFFSYSDSDTV